MQLTFFTTEPDFAREMTGPAAEGLGGGGFGLALGTMHRVPGAFDSYYQLAIDIGAISAPIGIMSNLLASWLYEAWRRASTVGAKKPTVRVVVRSRTLTVDVDVDAADAADAANKITAALLDADLER